MIKKLQFRFITITMACISLIFLLILIVINVSVTVSSRNQGYAFLERFAGSSEFPDAPDREEPFRKDGEEPRMDHPKQMGGFDALRSFFVSYDQAGSVSEVSFTENSGLTEDDILALAEQVSASADERGVLSKYLYLTRETGEGRRIYFLDYTREREMSLNLFWNCLYIGLAGILFIFALVIYLSRMVARPVEAAFEKQKQFIADASHELKTPLTIINANAEVLSGEIGENRWLNHILAQTKRMSNLIISLLELARLDAVSHTDKMMEFPLSRTVKNAALSFESVAYEYGKSYQMKIADHLSMTGDEAAIKQLVTILLDNAFKYSEEGGSVLITLSLHGDKKCLEVENSGKGIAKEEQKLIFERFYRSDSSRSRESGGYGLGLSIAASIAEAHKGHISVKSDGSSYTRFTVTL